MVIYNEVFFYYNIIGDQDGKRIKKKRTKKE